MLPLDGGSGGVVRAPQADPTFWPTQAHFAKNKLKALDENRTKKLKKGGVNFSQWKMRQKEMQKALTPLLGTIFSPIF